MSDVRQPVMEGVHHNITPEAPDLGYEFLRVALARPRADDRKLTIERAVEFEVVPRLLLAHQRKAANGHRAAVSALNFPNDVQGFAEMVLGRSEDAAGAHIQALREQNIPLEAIYLNLMAPAARHLKYQWLEDQRDFAEVTLGLWRLQQLLREFSAAFRAEGRQPTGLRSLLAPGPSEAHDLGYLMFGLVLLGEFFRRDGWDAWIEPAPDARALSSVIHNEWFDVVEFMVSGGKRLDELAASIKMVRKASLNRSLGVLVCGQAFVEHPELVLLVGGDMSAADPRDAAHQAQGLVRAIASRE
jgi:hypothetical protein